MPNDAGVKLMVSGPEKVTSAIKPTPLARGSPYTLAASVVTLAASEYSRRRPLSDA